MTIKSRVKLYREPLDSSYHDLATVLFGEGNNFAKTGIANERAIFAHDKTMSYSVYARAITEETFKKS